jgi:hypothetical protein
MLAQTQHPATLHSQAMSSFAGGGVHSESEATRRRGKRHFPRLSEFAALSVDQVKHAHKHGAGTGKKGNDREPPSFSMPLLQEYEERVRVRHRCQRQRQHEHDATAAAKQQKKQQQELEQRKDTSESHANTDITGGQEANENELEAVSHKNNIIGEATPTSPTCTIAVAEETKKIMHGEKEAGQ